jgi:hypothetical protein
MKTETTIVSEAQLEPNGLDFEKINPKLHKKFSPNLYRYLKGNHFQKNYSKVWKDGDNTLWIGWRDESTFLVGARLMQALCKGGRCGVSSWILNSIGELTEVKDFWQRYMDVGRCAIDPKHQKSFIGDDDRFTISNDGNYRGCTWCGHTQKLRKWTETIERSKWESL